MKGLFLFFICLIIVLPLYNVQRGDVFDVENIKDIYIVKLENGRLNYEKQEKSTFSVKAFENSDGVIVKYSGEVSELVQAFNVRTIKEEVLDGMKILYGYTDKYSDCIFIDGKQSNIQIVQTQNEIIAGFPIILSGF